VVVSGWICDEVISTIFIYYIYFDRIKHPTSTFQFKLKVERAVDEMCTHYIMNEMNESSINIKN
jgi:hypothetical protein